MSFSVRRDGDTVIIYITGRLLVGNRTELKELVFREWDTGARHFVVDFAETGFVDSAGLGALVSISKNLRMRGGGVRLCNLNDDLRTLFALTKLDTLFDIDSAPS